MKKIALAAALALLSTPAFATVNVCDGPNCAATDENVLVNAGPAPVIGVTNNTGAAVLFSSITDTLVGDANGQAEVGAVDGLLNSLKFRLINGNTFGAATFNLFPLAGNEPNEAISIILTWLLSDGSTASQMFEIGKNGQNFEGIFGTAGERFTSIEFLANPNTTGWGDLRQLRLGDVQGRNGGTPDTNIVETAVPEPMTWMTMILGFGMIGSMMRRKRSQDSKRVNFA
jgi:hypothetical protein